MKAPMNSSARSRIAVLPEPMDPAFPFLVRVVVAGVQSEHEAHERGQTPERDDGVAHLVSFARAALIPDGLNVWSFFAATWAMRFSPQTPQASSRGSTEGPSALASPSPGPSDRKSTRLNSSHRT